MTYAHRLRDFAHGLALPVVLALVHLRCARTAGQQRHKDPEDDPLRAARGVMNGIALSVPLWALVGLLLWWWLG